jgi:hypothetical protein
VGRLRRVYQRFGHVSEQYEGIYWSHFQAALEWDDAEMWLEGAVQNQWSVSQMHRTRWETRGDLAEQEPREEEIVAAELDEDFEPLDTAADESIIAADYAEVQGPPMTEGSDSTHEEEEPAPDVPAADAAGGTADDDEQQTVKFVRPFENLADLPEDLAEAFESFKLAVLRHKTDGWQQISCDDVLASLDALKALALAPSADAAPF